MMQIQKNKRTTWYFILFYFSASQSLIGSKQRNQRHDVTTDFFGGKILRVYCWEENHPAKFDKTDYQTVPITNFSLYLALLFHGHTKRLCPDPVVGLGARLGGLRRHPNPANKVNLLINSNIWDTQKNTFCFVLVACRLPQDTEYNPDNWEILLLCLSAFCVSILLLC